MRRGVLFVVATFASIAAGGGLALAQAQETEKPCIADAARLCKGVAPGGGAQMECLKAHRDELSPACKQKVMKAKIQKMERDELQKSQRQMPQ